MVNHLQTLWIRPTSVKWASRPGDPGRFGHKCDWTLANAMVSLPIDGHRGWSRMSHIDHLAEATLERTDSVGPRATGGYKLLAPGPLLHEAFGRLPSWIEESGGVKD